MHVHGKSIDDNGWVIFYVVFPTLSFRFSRMRWAHNVTTLSRILYQSLISKNAQRFLIKYKIRKTIWDRHYFHQFLTKFYLENLIVLHVYLWLPIEQAEDRLMINVITVQRWYCQNGFCTKVWRQFLVCRVWKVQEFKFVNIQSCRK